MPEAIPGAHDCENAMRLSADCRKIGNVPFDVELHHFGLIARAYGSGGSNPTFHSNFNIVRDIPVDHPRGKICPRLNGQRFRLIPLRGLTAKHIDLDSFMDGVPVP